jgi:1,4-dihydroxy-2-naphthoate octaprenyltransferase
LDLKILFSEARPKFLLLSVVIVFSGVSIAWNDGTFYLGWALLSLLGLLLAHISVNVLNDYFDYRSGVDLKTQRTPFSGGSGILPTAQLTQKQVFWMGMGSFLLTIPIGIYFIIARGWLLLPLLVVGALCILAYTPIMLKIRWPEWAAGLGLGTLPLLGVYYIQTATYTIPAVVASVPFGILVHNLLLLNEFPDVEADRTVNRKTLPIYIGKRRAGIIYSALTVLVYLWIIGGVVTGIMPVFSSVALLIFPIATKAIKGALNPEKPSNLIPAMANNVLVVLLTSLLLGVGYILNGVF